MCFQPYLYFMQLASYVVYTLYSLDQNYKQYHDYYNKKNASSIIIAKKQYKLIGDQKNYHV